MPANAAARFPEPEDFRSRDFPRLVPDGDEAAPPTRDAPALAPPGVVPPGAVASDELPWEQPLVRGIRLPPVTTPYWQILHASAGASCVLFLLLLVLLWMALLAGGRGQAGARSADMPPARNDAIPERLAAGRAEP